MFHLKFDVLIVKHLIKHAKTHIMNDKLKLEPPCKTLGVFCIVQWMGKARTCCNCVCMSQKEVVDIFPLCGTMHQVAKCFCWVMPLGQGYAFSWVHNSVLLKIAWTFL